MPNASAAMLFAVTPVPAAGAAASAAKPDAMTAQAETPNDSGSSAPGPKSRFADAFAGAQSRAEHSPQRSRHEDDAPPAAAVENSQPQAQPVNSAAKAQAAESDKTSIKASSPGEASASGDANASASGSALNAAAEDGADDAGPAAPAGADTLPSASFLQLLAAAEQGNSSQPALSGADADKALQQWLAAQVGNQATNLQVQTQAQPPLPGNAAAVSPDAAGQAPDAATGQAPDAATAAVQAKSSSAIAIPATAQLVPAATASDVSTPSVNATPQAGAQPPAVTTAGQPQAAKAAQAGTAGNIPQSVTANTPQPSAPADIAATIAVMPAISPAANIAVALKPSANSADAPTLQANAQASNVAVQIANAGPQPVPPAQSPHADIDHAAKHAAPGFLPDDSANNPSSSAFSNVLDGSAVDGSADDKSDNKSIIQQVNVQQAMPGPAPQHTQVNPASPALPNQPSQPAPLSAPSEQMIAYMRTVAQNGQSRIQLQLHPVELGKLDIRINLEGGKANLQITAENPRTLDMLRSDVQALQKVLTDVGFKADNSSLSFNLQGDQQSGGQYTPQQGQQQAYRNPLPDALDEALAQVSLQSYSISPTGLDIRI